MGSKEVSTFEFCNFPKSRNYVHPGISFFVCQVCTHIFSIFFSSLFNLKLSWALSSQHSWIMKAELWNQKLFEREFSMEALNTYCEKRLTFLSQMKFKYRLRIIICRLITLDHHYRSGPFSWDIMHMTQRMQRENIFDLSNRWNMQL